MSNVRIARPSYRYGLGSVLALALLIVGAPRADAQHVQTFPGSSCQASGSAQNLYYSGVTVANRGAATRSAICPLVRQNPTQGWLHIFVHVRDRHSTQNITCVAQARDAAGAGGWSESQSTIGEGNQTLAFAAPAIDPPNFGPYSVVCSLPPMEEVNQPSYISSLLVEEP
jgi:hypothetical protein